MGIKMLGNTFGAIPFESLKISLRKTRKLRVWIETDPSLRGNIKWWMIFVVNDTKSFKNFECFVTHSSAMTHPYKQVIADVFSIKHIFSTVDPSYNELWRGHEIFFDMITVQKWVEKIRKWRSCLLFLILCLLSSRSQTVFALKFSFKSFSLYGCHIATVKKNRLLHSELNLPKGQSVA